MAPRPQVVKKSLLPLKSRRPLMTFKDLKGPDGSTLVTKAESGTCRPPRRQQVPRPSGHRLGKSRPDAMVRLWRSWSETSAVGRAHSRVSWWHRLREPAPEVGLFGLLACEFRFVTCTYSQNRCLLPLYVNAHMDRVMMQKLDLTRPGFGKTPLPQIPPLVPLLTEAVL